jgi:hypothetical protein
MAPLPQESSPLDRAAWGTPQMRVALSSLVTAFGMLLISVSYTTSRAAWGGAEPLFWLGFVVIISPALIYLTSSLPGRGERQAILVVLALGLYAVKVFYSPTFFSFGDELQHLRSTQDLLASGRLFEPNPILPVSPSFPGFESVMSAVVSLSGLSIFQAGLLVVGMAKVLAVLALFALYELLGGSPRIASVGVLLYVSNPHFAFFDSQFAYESLGIPLVAFALVAIARRSMSPQHAHWMLLPIGLLGILAVVITHHVSSYVLLLVLATWSIVSVLDTSWEPESGRLMAITLFTLAAIVLWTWFVAFGTLNYLISPLRSGMDNLANLISGEAAARPLFHSFPPPPIWTRVASIASVVIILLALPFGLLRIWRARGMSALVVTLALLASSYPFAQALRFSSATLTLATRGTAYVFLGVGLVAALAAIWVWSATRRAHIGQLLMVPVMAVIFVGTMASNLSAWKLPGGYQANVYTHTIGFEGLALADWARNQLGPDNRFGADDPNTLLLGSYGRQRPITQQRDGVSLADRLFLASSFGQYEQALIKRLEVQYLVVDGRTRTRLLIPGSSPLRSQVDAIKGVDRVYDSGDIVVYEFVGSK